MPTYEYECEKCGLRFEVFQGLSEPPVVSCGKCRGPVRRLISTGAGVIVKGKRCESSGPGRHAGQCGHEHPCCGRDEFCGEAPCAGE